MPVQVYKENVKVLQPQAHSLTLGLKASDEFLRHIKITLATIRMSVLEKRDHLRHNILLSQ